MLKVIASDLDGTLLDADHRIADYTASTLRELHRQGVELILATGRHHHDVAGIRSVLGVPAYLITSNGARIHDQQDREIFAENVEAELVRALLQDEFTQGVMASLYVSDGWLVNEACPEIAGQYHQDSGFHYTVTPLASYHGEHVAKILYIADHDVLSELEERILARFADEIYLTFSADNCLEVMAPTVSKGHALTEVLARLGLSAEQCVAFGDGQNDIQLLQVAGHAYVMGNASHKLKSALPQLPVIGLHHEHGVARQLRTLFALPD